MRSLVANDADQALAGLLPAQLEQIVDGFLHISLLTVPVDHPRVRIAADVYREKIRVARHHKTPYGFPGFKMPATTSSAM